jgi:hypothetical protein
MGLLYSCILNVLPDIQLARAKDNTLDQVCSGG